MIIRLHLRVSPGLVRLGLCGLLLTGPAGELCSEPVTMTSYYPAPSGVYSQIVTTQNSFLARDGTSVLAIGTSGTAAGGTKMVVMGSVGIGTGGAAPTSKLQVTGAGSAANTAGVDVVVDGQLQTGDGAAVGGVWFNTQAVGSQFVGQNPNTSGPAVGVGFYSNKGNAVAPAAWGMTVTSAGNVGIMKNSPASLLDINGTLTVRDMVVGPCTVASLVAYGSGYASCGAGTFATWAPGVYARQQNGRTTAPYLTGHMFCCPCPSGSCAL